MTLIAAPAAAVARQSTPEMGGPIELRHRDDSPGLGGQLVAAPPLSVTTIAQGARVAMDRTRRFTLLGQLPIVGVLIIPWLWPLHMAIVGMTAGQIRITSDASLSFCDGSSTGRLRSAFLVAVSTFLLWVVLLVLGGTLLFRLRQEGLLPAGVLLAVIVTVASMVFVPMLLELFSLIEFAIGNPEWVTLKRDRRHGCDGRTTYVLTSLVARRDGYGYAADLMNLVYPQWQAADAVVIGYPASRHLISYYVRMGARRDKPRVHGRTPRRRITFDCRQPLRDRHTGRGVAVVTGWPPPAGGVGAVVAIRPATTVRAVPLMRPAGNAGPICLVKDLSRTNLDRRPAPVRQPS